MEAAKLPVACCWVAANNHALAASPRNGFAGILPQIALVAYSWQEGAKNHTLDVDGGILSEVEISTSRRETPRAFLCRQDSTRKKLIGGRGMRLLVFSPVRLFGEGLALAIGRLDGVTVCTNVHRLEELPDRIEAVTPDLVLFDVTAEHLLLDAKVIADAFPHIRILALALTEIPHEVIACAEAGFTGYIPREAAIEDLPTILQMALRGETTCHPTITGSLLREIRRRQHVPESRLVDPLTRRECEVLRMVGRGLCNKEIAARLSLSTATIKNHLHSVFGKLHVSGRSAAISRLRTEPWLERSA